MAHISKYTARHTKTLYLFPREKRRKKIYFVVVFPSFLVFCCFLFFCTSTFWQDFLFFTFLLATLRLFRGCVAAAATTSHALTHNRLSRFVDIYYVRKRFQQTCVLLRLTFGQGDIYQLSNDLKTNRNAHKSHLKCSLKVLFYFEILAHT